MSTPQQEVTERLGKIFMPYAVSRRDDMISRDWRFVHYTSAESAIKIIRTEEIWLRNAKCMNDYTEVSHGHEQLSRFFDKNRELFTRVLNRFGNQIAESTLKLFDQWWNEIQFNTFICSISEHNPGEDNNGRLSMWRAYGQSSAKAAIVLKIPLEPSDFADRLRVYLSPVAYFGYADVERNLLAVMKNISDNAEFLGSIDANHLANTMFMTLLMAAVSLKHAGFKEEREWRALYLPNLAPSSLVTREIETINSVPQIVYKVPLKNNQAERITGLSVPELIERIIIGPSSYPWPLFEAFKTTLEQAGVENAGSRVIVSGIPLRT